MKTFIKKCLRFGKRNFETFEEIIKKEPSTKQQVFDLINIENVTEKNDQFLITEYLLRAFNNSKMQWTKDEDIFLLIRASELLDKMNFDTFEVNIIRIQVAFHLREGEKILELFEKAKTMKNIKDMEPKDLYLLFIVSAHLGKWNDMRNFGKKLLELDRHFMKYLEENIETKKDSFIYSTIYKLIEDEKEDNLIIPKYEIFEFEKFELLHIYMKESTPKLNNTDVECGMKEDENNWFLIEHEIPKLIFFGGCVAWYQLNGSLHLSGIVKGNKKEIKIKGRGIYQDETTESYFNSEYEFYQKNELEYEGTHTRSVFTKVVNEGEAKSTSTFKLRFKFKKSLI